VVAEELETQLQELDQVVQVEVETHLLMVVVVRGQLTLVVEVVQVLLNQDQQKLLVQVVQEL
tara:strand:+ start:252 stop:437 length:186 start_codon:yes stop_codon:yes gene_type:complete